MKINTVTALPGNAGWSLVFDNGTTVTVGNEPGSTAITPQIELRTEDDGSVYLWYNITADYPDDGWVKTGGNLKGAQGPKGEPGSSSGIEFFDMRVSGGMIQYTTVEEPEDDDWIDLVAVPAGGGGGNTVSVVLTDNESGTVTIVAGSDSFTFPIAGTNITRIEVMIAPTAVIKTGETGEILFRVNPSDADVPTGTGSEIAGWALDLVTKQTRAGYVTDSGFVIDKIAKDAPGQYLATVSAQQNLAPAGAVMALVLTLEDDLQVTSGAFTLTSDVGALILRAGILR